MRPASKSLLTLLTIITIINTPGIAQTQHTAINTQASEPQATVKIVTSLSLVEDWVKQIGKDTVETTAIVSGLEDPHSYEPSQSEIAAVADADLFIWLGIDGLEPWVNSVLETTETTNTLRLVNDSWLEYDPLIEQVNGHVWLSPILVKQMVEEISAELKVLLPDQVTTIETNTQAYQQVLDGLIGVISEFKDKYEGTKVVVMHPSFKYIFDLMGIQRRGVVEISHDAEPSPEHIAELIQLIEEEKIKFLISQPQIDSDQLDEIADQTGILVVKITPLLGVDGIDTYQKLITNIVNTMTDAIEGRYVPESTNSATPGFGYLILLISIIGLSVVMRLRRPIEC